MEYSLAHGRFAAERGPFEEVMATLERERAGSAGGDCPVHCCSHPCQTFHVRRSAVGYTTADSPPSMLIDTPVMYAPRLEQRNAIRSPTS